MSTSPPDARDERHRDVEVMAAAIDEARRALEHDDVPVGAVVVHAGEVVASRHNERELTRDPVAHAEILALRDAAHRLGSWRLDECTLYVTLEPCGSSASCSVQPTRRPGRSTATSPSSTGGSSTIASR